MRAFAGPKTLQPDNERPYQYRAGGQDHEVTGFLVIAFGLVAKRKEYAMRGIVVGIDGSPNSERALDWAVKEAAALHAPLTVIAVNEVLKGFWTGQPIPVPADTDLLHRLRQTVEEITQKAVARLSAPGPASVTVHVANGFAAEELIHASQDADLIVVGTRGGGGFAQLVLGSVSSQVIHHAACPVVVVPHER
jgi:nucleotide-binding universal stress UspA family protein